MIFNLKDIDMNNYVSWVYSDLPKRIQTAETNITINSEDIDLLYVVRGLLLKEKEDA